MIFYPLNWWKQLLKITLKAKKRTKFQKSAFLLLWNIEKLKILNENFFDFTRNKVKFLIALQNSNYLTFIEMFSKCCFCWQLVNCCCHSYLMELLTICNLIDISYQFKSFWINARWSNVLLYVIRFSLIRSHCRMGKLPFEKSFSLEISWKKASPMELYGKNIQTSHTFMSKSIKTIIVMRKSFIILFCRYVKLKCSKKEMLPIRLRVLARSMWLKKQIKWTSLEMTYL